MLVDYKTFETRMKAVNAEVARCVAEAKRLWNLDISGMHVQCNLRGSNAGSAQRRGTFCIVKLNREMIGGPQDVYEDMIGEIISHEIAHIICFLKPELGRNHDYGWKAVHRALGGKGKRCHTTDVAAVNGGYDYLSSTGRIITLKAGRHNKMQRNPGVQYAFRNELGAISGKSPWMRRKPGNAAPTKEDFAAKGMQPLNVPHVTVKNPGGRTRFQMTGGVRDIMAALGLTRNVAPPTSRFIAPVPAPTVSKTIPVKVGIGASISKAEQVRHWIAEAKRDGRSQEWVMSMAQMHLHMPKGQAYRYVTENWSKV